MYSTSSIGLQRCHSKKVKNLRRANKKSQENLRSNFYGIGSNFKKKSNLFPKKPNFSRKKCLLSAKISDDLLLVINSDFQIFTLFVPKKLLITTANSLLLPK